MTEAIALNALETVNRLAEQLGAAESMMERGYAELAEALLVVQEGLYWQPEYESWGKYMEAITEKHKMGRAQLYQKLRTVKALQGVVETSALTAMGISKATVLADTLKKYEQLPNEIIAAANENAITKDQLKKKVAEFFHTPEDDTSEWIDLHFAFYVTPEEKAEIKEAEQAARKIDPPVSVSLTDFMQKKEVCLRWVREFLATYSGEEDGQSY